MSAMTNTNMFYICLNINNCNVFPVAWSANNKIYTEIIARSIYLEYSNQIQKISRIVFWESLDVLAQWSSTRGPRAACGRQASFVRPGKGISQNTSVRYEYWSMSH